MHGATYFVTFRLKDALPRHVVDCWREKHEAWHRAHGLDAHLAPAEWQRIYNAIPQRERSAFEENRKARYFMELDRSHGACLLRRPQAAQAVADALRFLHGKRLNCGDFVIMPNHVHWLLAPNPGCELERILQSVKRFAASKINRLCARTGPLWQKESYDHIVRNEAELLRIRTYIANNPGKALLRPGEYLYHCADDE